MLGRAAAGGALLLSSAFSGAAIAAPEAGAEPIAPDGLSGPFPILWLDSNGNHNQPAGLDLEPSHGVYWAARKLQPAALTLVCLTVDRFATGLRRGPRIASSFRVHSGVHNRRWLDFGATISAC